VDHWKNKNKAGKGRMKTEKNVLLNGSVISICSMNSVI
jgi:hypothetical protein